MTELAFKPVSDCALLVQLGTRLHDELTQTIIQLDKAITDAKIIGVEEVVPALINLLVVFDPIITDHEGVKHAVEKLFPLPDMQNMSGQEHVIEITYGGQHGPDLAAVAEAKGASEEAIIRAHTSCVLKVGMYGFAPGYAYLTGLPESLQLPRKKSAVRDVPAGSVIIAGAQCLITSLTMPTGWNIIGHAKRSVFTNNPAKPFLFEIGDTVRFKCEALAETEDANE